MGVGSIVQKVPLIVHVRKSGVNTTLKFGAVSAQKRFQGATQALEAVRMVPPLFEGGSGSIMAFTNHM